MNLYGNGMTKHTQRHWPTIAQRHTAWKTQRHRYTETHRDRDTETLEKLQTKRHRDGARQRHRTTQAQRQINKHTHRHKKYNEVPANRQIIEKNGDQVFQSLRARDNLLHAKGTRSGLPWVLTTRNNIHTDTHKDIQAQTWDEHYSTSHRLIFLYCQSILFSLVHTSHPA